MLRYLVSMTEYYKAGHYLDQYERKMEEHVLDAIDRESGYLPRDVKQLELRYPDRKIEQSADDFVDEYPQEGRYVETRSESGESIFREKDEDFAVGPEGMEGLIVSSLDVPDETLKAIRKGAKDMSSEEILAEQEKVYEEMRKQAEEVAKKIGTSPEGSHGVGGFLSPMKLREMYREPDPVEVSKGFETLDLDAPYEQLLSQAEQLNMDLLSQEEKMKLVRLLELKATGGDPNLI